MDLCHRTISCCAFSQNTAAAEAVVFYGEQFVRVSSSTCVFDNVQQIISPTDDGDSKEERKDKKSSCQVKELVLVHKAGIYLSVLSFALCFALKQAGVDVSTMLRKV